MALLSIEERKEFFKTLGLGEYNEENIEKVQKKYMLRKKDVDGKYGNDTDNLLRHLMNCHLYLKKENFKPEEFRCGCGGKHCCGYPTYMKPMELKNIQSIRSHYGKPMIITCGVRCVSYNRAVGGIQNSEHLKGLAVDYYIQGVTDTLANRKKSIAWIKTLPNHHYTYGNGINSNGYKVNYPGMGNALHTDSYDRAVPSDAPTPTPSHSGELIVDGVGGKATIIATQKFLGCVADGVISSQNKALQKYYPSIIAVEFAKKPQGSACIKALQRWLGVPADGIIGVQTVKAWQRKLGINADGIFGKGSMKAWQKFLNKELSAKGTDTSEPAEKPSTDSTQPSTPIVDEGKAPYKVIDVSNWQDKIDWVKVKADGVVGAIIRYGDGSFIDTRFDENMRNAKAAGLHIGAYIYSRATSKEQARNEAERLFNACEPYAPDMPLYIDLEAKGYGKYADDVAIAFLNKIKSLGGRGGVYANLNWWNNYLKKTAKDYSSNAFWIAQYNDTMDYKPASKMGMWQYTSSGKVNGISGRVDMNKCYVAYWDTAVKPSTPHTDEKPTEPTNPPTEPKLNGYSGEMPTLKLNKTNAEVIEDAVKWAAMIAGDNRFHYGYTNKHGSKDSEDWNPNAHHNGCYFCGTNTDKGGRSKKGILDYERTYCCNPFVGAAWAHGGCVPKALELCRKGSSWDYHKGKGYDKSSLFEKLGKPKKSKLQKGDVLCSDSHVALYIGNGKIAHASGGDDNVRNSAKWNKSIRTEELTSTLYKKFTRVYRFKSSVNTTQNIYFGEISKRVEHLQRYIDWFTDGAFFKECGEADGIFGNNTHRYVKEMQRKLGLPDDGVVSAQTLEAMAKVVK